MRELEFLPPSYRQTHRRKRTVAFQFWILLMLAAGLGGWLLLAQRNVASAAEAVSALQRQLDQTHADQKVLADKLSLRQKLQDQEELVASLGYPVQMTRLMQTLDTLMPKEMSLVEFECTTEETPRVVSSVAAVRTQAEARRQMDRRLRVRLQGVSPSNVSLANFLTGLGNVPFFEQVAVKYSKDIASDGHLLKEFEITFWMNLSQ